MYDNTIGLDEGRATDRANLRHKRLQAQKVTIALKKSKKSIVHKKI